MANLPNRHSGPPLPPQSPQHRASAPGPGEHDKYLAELLQERQKLTPFIPVLPNCSRLLNAEIARTSKLVGEMLQDSDQHTGAAPSNSAYAQSGLLSGSNASPAPPVPSYSSYEPVAPWQQPMSSYDSLLPDAQIRPPAQQQGYGAAPPSMPLTGGNPYGGTVGGGGSSYGGPGGGPGGAGGSSMYGAPGGGSAYGAPGGAPGGGSAYGGPGGAPGGGSAYGGPGGGGPTYGTVYGGGDAMIQQQGPLMMRRARRFDIAVDKFPAQVNCVARILGLKGATLRHIESTTGCRLLIRGRGSIKDQKKEAVMFGKPGYEHLMEPLHVMIEAEMPAHVVEYHINQASEMIENALLGLYTEADPPPSQEHKEPSKSKGPPNPAKKSKVRLVKRPRPFWAEGKLSEEEYEKTRAEGACFYCKEPGHKVSDCPVKQAEMGQG